MSRNCIYTQVLSLFTILLLSSCAGVQKMAVGTTGSLMYEATKGLESEGNWHNFKVGSLPNLLLVDGLLSLKPDDRELLVTAIKGYTEYAIVIN